MQSLILFTISTFNGLVFFFDNRSSGMSGIVLLASIAVLFLCLFVWLIFGLGNDHGFGQNSLTCEIVRAQRVGFLSGLLVV